MPPLTLLPAVNAAALPGTEIKVDQKEPPAIVSIAQREGERQRDSERERQFRRQLSTREVHEEAWGRGGRREVKSHVPKL